MFNMRIARRTLPLMLIALATAGCAPTLHSVRVRTAEGREWTAVPRPHPPVAITEEELQRATVSLARNVVPVEDPLEYARQLFELPARSGWFFYNRRTKQLAPLDLAAAADFLPAEVVELTRSYLQWCHNRQQAGDCLRLLRHGYALDADARLAVAMRIALGSVMQEIEASLEGLANREAVCAMIASTAVMMGVLLLVPEPFTKLVAAAITAALVVYLGVDTIYSLRDGWRRLEARTDAAETFDELRSAGEEFGKVMGANAARVLVMVAAAALGSTAGDVAKVLPRLTGTSQALRLVTAEGAEVEVEAVRTATIAKSGITLTLAPGAAVASTIGTQSGEGNPGARPSAAARVGGSLDDLANAGKAMDRGGLTRAGRALEKHGGRQGSLFPKATGNVAEKNRQGQEILEDILTNPGTKSSPNSFGGQDFFDPSGRGARFNQDGSFRGFLEPPTP